MKEKRKIQQSKTIKTTDMLNSLFKWCASEMKRLLTAGKHLNKVWTTPRQLRHFLSLNNTVVFLTIDWHHFLSPQNNTIPSFLYANTCARLRLAQTAFFVKLWKLYHSFEVSPKMAASTWRTLVSARIICCFSFLFLGHLNEADAVINLQNQK